jgi:hypothetical protein
MEHPFSLLRRRDLQPRDEPSAAPKLDGVDRNETSGFLNYFSIIGTNQRLIPDKMSVLCHRVRSVFGQPEVPAD